MADVLSLMLSLVFIRFDSHAFKSRNDHISSLFFTSTKSVFMYDFSVMLKYFYYLFKNLCHFCWSFFCLSLSSDFPSLWESFVHFGNVWFYYSLLGMFHPNDWIVLKTKLFQRTKFFTIFLAQMSFAILDIQNNKQLNLKCQNWNEKIHLWWTRSNRWWISDCVLVSFSMSYCYSSEF